MRAVRRGLPAPWAVRQRRAPGPCGPRFRKVSRVNVDNAVLGLVRMHPDVSGYQIKSIFDTSPGHIVPMHLSKIYPALKRLTEKGLVTCRVVPREGRPDQKFYTITDAGEAELVRWFEEPFKFGTNRAAFDEYLLWLGSMAYLDDAHVLNMIDQGIAYLEDRIATEGDADRIQAGYDYITPKNKADAERHRKIFAFEHKFLLQETENRLKQLRELRKLFE